MKEIAGNQYRKSNGKIELFTGVYLLIFLLVILFVQLQMKLFLASSAYVEDALAASNLASAVVDVQKYGMTHVIRIASPDAAYELYQEALRYNLDLDDEWKCSNQAMIQGKVELLKYQIYNVEKHDITIYSYGADGEDIQRIPGGLGHVYTPDGVLVESTSVYSKISFPVRGFLGVEITGQKQKTVDIVSSK